MANVTYLLGAGASYNAFPTVTQFTDAITHTIEAITDLYTDEISLVNMIPYDQFTKEQLKTAIDDLVVLKEGCQNHLSIDTFAKMLYLTGNEKYKKIKNTISLFFDLYSILVSKNNGFVQKLDKSKLDKRYDAFFAAILHKSYYDFPDNIRMITYNYDNQFIDTYKRYIEHTDANTNSIYQLKIYSRGENIRTYETRRFSIFKINGSAGFLNKHDLRENLFFPDHSFGDITGCTSRYSQLVNSDDYNSAISFAWEANPEEDTFIQETRLATTMSDILVVIGYSFPYFNREIDSCIFRKDSMHQLTKIYVQDENADEIIERIKAIRSDGVDTNLQYIPIYKTDQFYLPNEL